MDDDSVARAIEGIADGVSVDWAGLKQGANGEVLGLLKGLEIIGAVAQMHRLAASSDDPIDVRGSATVRGTPEASTMEDAHHWGRYQLLESVGQGSFGSVYRAWDPDLEHEIAIKILHPQYSNQELRGRLLGEGRVLARVNHSNVVKVLGVESHGDRVGLCMEFVQGETLDSMLRRQGTLNAREAKPIAEDICSALSAVHRAGLIHRDVKTKNVMRDRTGRIVLMDFGTGREAEEAARAGALDLVGTPLYMAPEVLLGEEPATTCSDVYSVGVLIYHMVTGEFPVEGRNVDELEANHRAGRQRLLSDRRSDLPAPFTQVVTRAIARDPQQRYATPGALRDALRKAADDGWQVGTFLRPIGVVGGVALFLTALGMLSTLTFNVSLGRSGFAGETVWDALYWGVRSCVGPAFTLLMSFAALGLVSVIRRLLLAASATAAGLDGAVRHRLAVMAHRVHLDETSVLASYALLIFAMAVIVACWYFQPLLLAFTMNATMAPRSVLALLAPGPGGVPNDVHVNYRITFTWIAIVSTVGWYLIWRRSVRKRQPLQASVLAGGVGVVVFALALVDYPFRIFYHNQFDVAAFRDERCYMLGQRADDVLLFCPMSAPPRNRLVKVGGPDWRVLKERESVFRQFADNQ